METSSSSSISFVGTPPQLKSDPDDQKCNVDYFSHNWTETDLKSSWSVITKYKLSHADGLRLENASWRRWMQHKFNLKRISPHLVHWKKEEDITWLYGPFIRQREYVQRHPQAVTVVDNRGQVVVGGASGFAVAVQELEQQQIMYPDCRKQRQRRLSGRGSPNHLQDEEPAFDSTKDSASLQWRHRRAESAPGAPVGYQSDDEFSNLEFGGMVNADAGPSAPLSDQQGGKSSLKSALKKRTRQTLLSDFLKFQQETDKKMRKLLVKLNGSSARFDNQLPPVSLDIPIEERQLSPVSPAAKTVTSPTKSKSENDIFLKTQQDLFLTQAQQRHLLEYLGPNTGQEPSNRPRALKAFKNSDGNRDASEDERDSSTYSCSSKDSAASGSTASETKKRPKHGGLRFNTQVEVLEYDASRPSPVINRGSPAPNGKAPPMSPRHGKEKAERRTSKHSRHSSIDTDSIVNGVTNINVASDVSAQLSSGNAQTFESACLVTSDQKPVKNVTDESTKERQIKSYDETDEQQQILSPESLDAEQRLRAAEQERQQPQSWFDTAIDMASMLFRF